MGFASKPPNWADFWVKSLTFESAELVTALTNCIHRVEEARRRALRLFSELLLNALEVGPAFEHRANVVSAHKQHHAVGP